MELKNGKRKAKDLAQEQSPLWMCADAVKWSRADSLAASTAWLETNPQTKAKFVAGLASVVGTAAVLVSFGLMPAVAAGLGSYALGQAIAGVAIHFARAQAIASLAKFGHQWINEANRRGMDKDAFKEVFRPRIIARSEHYSPQDWALAARGSVGQKALGLTLGLSKGTSAFGALCLTAASTARWISPSGHAQLKRAKNSWRERAMDPSMDWRLMPSLASQKQAEEIDLAIDSDFKEQANYGVKRISKRL